jgi:hypothetical protein
MARLLDVETRHKVPTNQSNSDKQKIQMSELLIFFVENVKWNRKGSLLQCATYLQCGKELE